ncbi:MAG: 50S ribosomal protein L14 [Candidatus Hodgkinia cicadicola]|nr:MAG: 50S ribosomal protein L14 [Candidatus Hodgkinia cicadicola]
MIQLQTVVKTADNSGVRYVRCIKVLGSSKKRWAKLGDLIKASAIDVTSKSKFKKGQVLNAVVIRTTKPFARRSEALSFSRNAVVVLNEKLEPVGTRVLGPVPKEVKALNFKVFALASEYV